MKKLIMVLASLMLMAVTAHAEHFKFMGIPIDGSIYVFEKALLDKGFTRERTPDDSSEELLYTGTFNGDKVTLAVYATPVSHKVCSVGLSFSDLTSTDTRNAKTARIREVIELKYQVDNVINIDEGTITYFVDNNSGLIKLDNTMDNLILFYVDIANFKLAKAEEDADI